MNILGFQISRAPKVEEKRYIPSTEGWQPWLVSEPYTGAWQRGESLRIPTLDAHHAVFACKRLLSSDVSKCRIKLVQQDNDGIWTEVQTPNPFDGVLKRPNRYQNRIQFYENWVLSLLSHGNTYVLKERDARGIVTDMYILDPCRTKPLVADDGSVFYQVSKDNLAGIEEDSVTIPASEIIHDRFAALYHPLCGVSPLTACALAATQGMNIQQTSATFFQNEALPGGILTAPGTIPREAAERLKNAWEGRFSGPGRGRVAILGDGLEFKPVNVTAADSQLIEQLKWSAETVCSAFAVPPHKVSIGQQPNYNNIEALDTQYYSQCLQSLVERIELLLDEGLGLVNVVGRRYGVEFDLDDLFRLDSETKTKAIADAVKAGVMSPNEARLRFNLPPTEGGEQPYLQNQNWSLAALSRRGTPPDTESQAAADPPPADAGQRQALLAYHAGQKARAMLASFGVGT